MNQDNQLLITKRSKDKLLWPLSWETSCSSHVLENESYKQAGERRIKEELGISIELKYLLKFQYKAKYENRGYENEICGLLSGKYDGDMQVNSKEISGYEWISIDELEKDIIANPKDYAPWLKEIIAKYKGMLESYELLLDKRDINKIINITKETGAVIDKYIEGYIKFLKSVDLNFGEICSYTISNRISTEKGKPKLRSTFVRLIYQALKKLDTWEEIIPIAAAGEIWAIATYTIDDILDKQPIRDHVDTAWKKYGMEKTIIAGIIQREIAEKMIFDSKIEKDKLLEIIKTFVEMQFYVYYGQYLNELEVFDKESYIKRVKYLSFDAAPLAKMAAIAADASKEEVELVYKIGENLGIASMMRNDLMDIIPEKICEEKNGMISRMSLEDLRKGILTYSSLFFMQLSEENKIFINMLKGKSEITDKQKELLIKKLFASGAIDASLDLITEYKNNAIELTNQLESSEFKDSLLKFLALMENTRIYVQEIKKSFQL